MNSKAINFIFKDRIATKLCSRLKARMNLLLIIYYKRLNTGKTAKDGILSVECFGPLPRNQNIFSEGTQHSRADTPVVMNSPLVMSVVILAPFPIAFVMLVATKPREGNKFSSGQMLHKLVGIECI